MSCSASSTSSASVRPRRALDADAEQVEQDRVGVAQAAVGAEQGHADGHGVEDVGRQGRGGRRVATGARRVDARDVTGPDRAPDPLDLVRS